MCIYGYVYVCITTTKEKKAKNLRENKRAHGRVWKEEREGENDVTIS